MSKEYCHCEMRYLKLPKMIGDEMICNHCNKDYFEPYVADLERMRKEAGCQK